MAINEEARQVGVAAEVAEVVATLAHSTRSVPHPADSYELLASLRAAQEGLAQVYRQLASWHGAAVNGIHYNGVDADATPGVPAVGPDGQVTGLLTMAAASADEAAALVGRAHSANGVVRWFEYTHEEEGRS